MNLVVLFALALLCMSPGFFLLLEALIYHFRFKRHMGKEELEWYQQVSCRGAPTPQWIILAFLTGIVILAFACMVMSM